MNIFTTYEKKSGKPQTENENNNISKLDIDLPGIPQVSIFEYLKLQIEITYNFFTGVLTSAYFRNKLNYVGQWNWILFIQNSEVLVWNFKYILGP